MSSEEGRLAGSIRAEGLGKRYTLGSTRDNGRTYRSLREQLAQRVRFRRNASFERDYWALRDLSFEINPGERVGIIGRNGAGKSTLLKILSRITPPTRGRVEVTGRVGSLLEVGAGFHPELTGRDNVFLSGAVYGMRRAEILQRFDDIVEFSGVAKFLDTPVKRYSSGMYLRLAFSVAAHLDTDILLVDEVLAVGDADFQRKCLGRISSLQDGERTILFVSHSMPAVLRICKRVMLLDGGTLVADGRPHEAIRMYLDSGFGSTAEREWPDQDTAPGDDVARLKSIRVRNDDGAVSEEIDIAQPFQVDVEYWHLSTDPKERPCVGLVFTNEDGVCLFTTVDFSNQAWWARPRQPGLITATCRLPANLLAEGRLFITAALCSYEPNRLHAHEPDAVAFQVVDLTKGEGVRGGFTNEWPGVVRPMLQWEVQTAAAEVTAE